MNTLPLITKLLILILPSIIFGLSLTVSVVTGLALANGQVEESSIPDILPETDETGDSPAENVSLALSIPYARVIADNVPVYTHPEDATLGLPPARILQPGFVFVSLEDKEPITYQNEVWYQINPDEYVRAEHLKLVTPSMFKGVALSSQPEQPFGWIIRDTPVLTTPNMTPAEDTPYISRYEMVPVYEVDYSSGEWGWRRIGENAWVNLYDVGMVQRASRPAEIPPGERWVEVNLFEQTLAAYDENDRMIYATLISAGRLVAGWETPEGIFQIDSKVKKARMQGGGRLDYYFIEDVTETMYFTETYAFHAAYWHDDFGRYKSHGCINMSPKDAQWMFGWVTPSILPEEDKIEATDENPGTWVWIHGGTAVQRQ